MWLQQAVRRRLSRRMADARRPSNDRREHAAVVDFRQREPRQELRNAEARILAVSERPIGRIGFASFGLPNACKSLDMFRLCMFKVTVISYLLYLYTVYRNSFLI